MLAPLGTAESDPVSEDDEVGLAVAAGLAVAVGPAMAVGLAVAAGLAVSAGLEGPKQSAAMNSVPVTRWIHECFRVLVSSFTCLRLSGATDAHPQDR
jgi:hypothetical protein